MIRWPGRAFRVDLSWTVASLVGTTLLQLALQVFIVRQVSTDAYGAYASVAAVVGVLELTLLSRSSEVALQVLGRSWVAGEFERARAVARRVARRDAAITGAGYVSLVLAAPFLGARFGFSPIDLVVLGLSAPAQIGYGASKGLFIAAGRIREQSRFELIFALVLSVACGAGVAIGGIPGLLWGRVLSSAAKTVIAWYVVRPWWPAAADPAARAAAIREVNAESWSNIERHAIARNLLGSLASQADVLLLAAVSSNSAVAIYKVAKTLSQLPARVAGPLWAAIRPRLLVAWHARDLARVRRLIVTPALGFLVLGLAVFPLVLLCARPGIVMLYGAPYATADVPFVILLCAVWLSGGVMAWFPFWLAVSAQQRWGTVAAACSVAALAALGIAFGRTATLMAVVVAASTCVGASVSWYAYARAYHRLTHSQ